MRWSQYDLQAKHMGGGAWHSGRLLDVLIQPSRLLIATETGNVWRAPLTPSAADPPRAVSDFVAPDRAALAEGPDGPDHVFAAGGKSWAFAAPAVAALAGGSASLFAVGGDRALYQFPIAAGTAQPVRLPGGDIRNLPSVIVDGGMTHVFVTGFDGALYHRWSDGTTWWPTTSAYQFLGGTLASSPAAVNAGLGQFHVLVLGTDWAIWHKWWDGSHWHPTDTDFARIGGTFMGTPTAVRTGPGQLAVLAVDRNDHSIKAKRWDGAAWLGSPGTFDSLGGSALTAPRATSLGDGTIDVVALLSPSLPNYQQFDGGSWMPAWEPFDQPAAALALTRLSETRLDVIVVGADGTLRHLTRTAGRWSSTTAMQATATGQPDIAVGPDGRAHLGWDNGGALFHTSWTAADAGPPATGTQLPTVTVDAVRVTDTTASDPLGTWFDPVLPQAAGKVFDVLVQSEQRRVMVATEHGVWWSPIPHAGVGASGYAWRQADGLPDVGYSGLAAGLGETVVAAAWGEFSRRGNGLFLGDFATGNLHFRRAQIQGIDTRTMARTSVASCRTHRDVLYAVACDPYPYWQNPPRTMAINDRPAALAVGGQPHVLVRSSVATVEHGFWDGTAWQWESLGGTVPKAPVAAASSAMRIDLVVIGTDRAIWHRLWDGTSWAGWERLGGTAVGQPALCARSDGVIRVDLFFIGDDGHVRHAQLTASGWQGGVGHFDDMGGGFCGTPAAACTTAGDIHLVVVGDNGALYHRRSTDGRTWLPTTGGGWDTLGSDQLREPCLVATAPHEVDLFALGLTGSVLHRHWNGSWDPSFGDLGGSTLQGPVAVADSGRVDVYIRGTDDQVGVNSAPLPGRVFGGFTALGGDSVGTPARAIQSPPGVAATSVGQRDIFGLADIDGVPLPRTELATSLWHLSISAGTTSAWTERPGRDLRCMVATLSPTTILASADGGATWRETRSWIPDTSQFLNFASVMGNQGDFNNTITVHPFDSRYVVVGWRGWVNGGHYISRDAGDTFGLPLPLDSPHLHGDVHRVRFSPDGSRLYVCSDGGLTSSDESRSWSTDVNHYLPVLQHYQLSARGSDGRIAAAAQDNGVIVADVGAEWSELLDSDGTAVLFLRNGPLLYTNGGAVMVTYGSDGAVPILVPGPGDTSGSGLIVDGMYSINSPQFTNASGQKLYGVAWSGPRLYGIFSNADGSGVHFEFLAAIHSGPSGPGNISAASSGSGYAILLGFQSGAIGRLYLDRPGVPFAPTSVLPPPGGPGWVQRIFELDHGHAFALVNRGANGYVMRLTGDLWMPLTRGLPVQPFTGLALDWTKTPQTVYVSTAAQVYRSSDNGDSFAAVSEGLPLAASINDLDFAVIHDRGTLFAATFGRSVWTAIPD